MTITSKLKTKPTKFNKEMINSVIANHAEVVLTTINPSGTPSSSVVTLHKLGHYTYFFMTKDTTKKYDNLETNPNVTLMIFDPFSRTELEIKGLAEYNWSDHVRQRALKIIDRDAKLGRHHISPYVSKKDAYALYIIHPQSIHMSTFWDRGNGPEIFQASIEFTVTDTDDTV